MLKEKIRELRKKKGLTLEQLAKASKSSKSYIWELENKNPPRPSGEKLALIAKALDVTPDFLLGVENNLETAEDKEFFRKYLEMRPDQKLLFRKIMTEIIKSG